MIILTLDMATSTGWAVGDTNTATLISSGVEKLGKGSQKYLDLGILVGTLCKRHCAELVAWEAPFAHSRNKSSLGHGYRLEGALVYFLAANGIGHLDGGIEAATIKKHATGKGNAKKPEMIEAARRRWGIERKICDNEADALCLLDYLFVNIEAKNG